MKDIVKVNNDNIYLLNDFIDNLGEAAVSFRYYSKRGVEAIQNHLITMLYMVDEKPVGYGHLDFFENEVWLGIAVLPAYQGKGIGYIIMDYLIKTAHELKLNSIALTVDNQNESAVALYLKKGFEPEKKFDTYTKYRLSIL
jgi:ribosomal protein S18 acetylase RimI-like enzyme